MVIRYIRVNWKLHLNKTFSVVCEKTQKYIIKKNSQKFLLFPSPQFSKISLQPQQQPIQPARRTPEDAAYIQMKILFVIYFPTSLNSHHLQMMPEMWGWMGGSLATPAVESVKNKMKYEQKQRERETEGKQ